MLWCNALLYDIMRWDVTWYGIVCHGVMQRDVVMCAAVLPSHCGGGYHTSTIVASETAWRIVACSTDWMQETELWPAVQSNEGDCYWAA